MANEERTITTAQRLGQYHRELLAAGLPEGLARDLVREVGFGIGRDEGVVIDVEAIQA